MKKISVLLGLLIFTAGCEKEEVPAPQEDILSIERSFLQEIHFQDLPRSVTYFLQGKDLAGNKNNGLTRPFGSVRTDIPAKKIVSEEGKISYTLVLEIPASTLSEKTVDFYFDNLVIYEQDKAEDIAYVVRYFPTSNWYNNSKDFKDYSGSITFFLPTGERINSIEVVEGEMKGNSGKNENLKAVCNLKLESTTTLCTELFDEDNKPLGQPNCKTTYNYKWYCSPGESGGNDDENPGPDHEEVPLGGGGTAPTLPEPVEVKVVNDLDDPCASLIFNQLHLLSMDHDLPPAVSYDSIGGLEINLHFTEAILDLFNDSNKYNFIVNKDNSLAINTNAKTKYPATYNPITKDYTITTGYNPDYFDDATDLSMARTMIHESVHAYLIYVLRGEPFGDMKEALDA